MSAITDALVLGLPIPETAIRDLERICPGAVVRDVSLASISRWRIGGIADVIVRPFSIQQVQNLCRYLQNNTVPYVVIGATSNLLFSDDGLRAVCIQIGGNLAAVSVNGMNITVQSGAWTPGVARRVMQAGLTGAEHTCGIPGTMGGLICMNGGSQRKGIGENVLEVLSVNHEGKILHRKQGDCGFGYRASVFQGSTEIIVEVSLRFPLATDKRIVRRKMLEILRSRRSKFPKQWPNCGSVFISNPTVYQDYGPPGAIIDRMGLKGLWHGGAQISECHANFIINRGGATARDVIELVSIVSRRVHEVTGVSLSSEIHFIKPDGCVVPLGK